MKYITDIHALNIPCSLGTTGDWHMASLQWTNPRMLESEDSPFGDYGIEINSEFRIPEHEEETFNIANHIRACLDMLAQGRFTLAQGMNGVYFDDERYDQEIFGKVLLLKESENWNDIKSFMEKEYGAKWTDFLART